MVHYRLYREQPQGQERAKEEISMIEIQEKIFNNENLGMVVKADKNQTPH